MDKTVKNNLYLIIIAVIFIIGILLRLKAYLLVRPLWHDECSLAISILDRNILGYFRALAHLQSAPPLFMMSTKFITLIAGFKELALRFIPQISGLLSIWIFYQLTRQTFKKKTSIIAANILFSINYYLIYYSQEFKQYSSDVLLVITAILVFSKINLKNLTTKQLLIAGILTSLLPLISIPATFVIGAFLITQIIKYKKSIINELLIFFAPIACVMLVYLITIKQQTQQIEQLKLYWNDLGFIKPSIKNILLTIKTNYAYYFRPNKLVVIAIIMTFAGIYETFKRRTNTVLILAFFTILEAIFCSIMQIYPIYERVSLYLAPLIILLISIPFEKFSKSKIYYTSIYSILFILYFSGYNSGYFKHLFSNDLFLRKDSRSALQTIINSYKEDEYILYNTSSDSEYFYYSRYFKFSTPKTGIINLPVYKKELYNSILNSLPDDRNYWFYYAYDNSKEPVVEFLLDWSKDKKVTFQKEFNGAVILRIQND